MSDPEVPPAPRRRRSIAHWIAGFAVVAFVAECAFILSPTGRRITGAIFEFGGSAIDAMNAPGTDELRAIGCDPVMVWTVGELMDSVGGVVEDARVDWSETSATPDTVLVQCRVRVPLVGNPTCEDVARTFGSSGAAPARFVVMHQRPGRERCGGYYAPDGTRLGGVDSRSFDLLDE